MGIRKLLNRIRTMMTEKRIPASAERNKEPIHQVLKKLLPTDKDLKALEIASGSGLHVGYLASCFPRVTWQPSEFDQEHWPSLRAYKSEHTNILDPVEIDISTDYDTWGCTNLVPGSIDLILNINMIHISPWAATQGLFKNAGDLLSKDGILVTYGPYAKNGILEPETNVNFNRYLQDENGEWGIRDIADITEEGNEFGLCLSEEYDMPSNNKMLVFRRNACLG